MIIIIKSEAGYEANRFLHPPFELAGFTLDIYSAAVKASLDLEW